MSASHINSPHSGQPGAEVRLVHVEAHVKSGAYRPRGGADHAPPGFLLQPLAM